MKTTNFNPSSWEVALAEALAKDANNWAGNAGAAEVTHVNVRKQKDNPDLQLEIKDADGDVHSFVITIIQRPE